MFQASEKLHAAILGNQRTFLSKIVVNGTEITSGIRSILTTSYVSEDNAFSIGGIASSKVDIVMWEPSVNIDGVEFSVYIGMNTDDSVEWVPMGMFTAVNPSNDDGLMTFTGYDRIHSKMTGQYTSNLTYPTDAKNALREIASSTGVPIDTSSLPDGIILENRVQSKEQDVDVEGNEVTNVTYIAPFDGYTYKDALYYIAQLYAAHAYADRDGTVRFKKIASDGKNVVVSQVNRKTLFYYDANENMVKTDADYAIEDGYLIIADDSYIGSDGNMYYKNDYVIKTSRYYDDLVLNTPAFSITGIKSTYQNDEFVSGKEVNVLIENPAMTQDILDDIYNDVSGLNFIPASVSFLGDMCLEFGDVVSVIKKNGEAISIPIMHIIHDFDGGVLTSIQSFGIGENGTTSSYESSPTSQRIDRLEEDVLNVKEIVAEKAKFSYVYALDAEFRNIRADYGEFKQLTAENIAVINGEFEVIKANQAEFQQITTENISAINGEFEVIRASQAEFEQITAENIAAINGEFENLSIKYATIDLANIENGTITNAMIADAAITAAKIKDVDADTITAGTLSVDRLIIRGSEKSIIYEINNIPGSFQSENSETINGEIITKRTIDADKLVARSVTAYEIDVADLFAQDITATGTIRGLNIVGATGSFTGTIDARDLLIKENIKLYLSTTSDYETIIKAVTWLSDVKTVKFGFADSDCACININLFPVSDGTETAFIQLGENADKTSIALNGATNIVGNSQIYGDLLIDGGTVTITKTTDLSGTANKSPALIVGGAATSTHMEIDANEIQAKASGTTTGNLFLNNDGGIVYIGPGGLDVDAAISAAGNIDVGSSTTAAARYVKTTNAYHSIGLYCSTSGNAGLYDYSYSKWMIYSTSSGTVIANTSDRRAKNDHGIISRDETLNILRGIKEHEFVYKNDKNEVVQYGIIAQELRDVLVDNEIGYRPIIQINDSTSDSGDVYNDLLMPEDMVTYSIDYSKLVPVLHDGWQYHDEKLNLFETRIEDLETTVLSLVKQIEKLKKA